MRYVLFVCNHNAGRSQMAQAFLERDAPSDVRAESAGNTPAKTICADAILADYRDAPIRSFVMTIAHRRARACLKQEHCEVVAAA